LLHQRAGTECSLAAEGADDPRLQRLDRPIRRCAEAAIARRITGVVEQQCGRRPAAVTTFVLQHALMRGKVLPALEHECLIDLSEEIAAATDFLPIFPAAFPGMVEHQ